MSVRYYSIYIYIHTYAAIYIYVLYFSHRTLILSLFFQNQIWHVGPTSCFHQPQAATWPPPLFCVEHGMVTSPLLLGDVTPYPMPFTLLAFSVHFSTPISADSGHLRPPFHPHSSPLFTLYTCIQVVFSPSPTSFFSGHLLQIPTGAPMSSKRS